MAASVVVRARIDENVKEAAAAVLAEMGLTVSDAFRLMLIRVARDKSLPFDINPIRATSEMDEKK
jgi:DNA-damage-inducible protein J